MADLVNPFHAIVTKLLDTREGPLRLIVAGDKRGARWVRGVIAFEVVRVR
jgi:hypothetical protein